MTYKNTTAVPNSVFDTHLAQLSGTELKMLLVIIRQTLGWKEYNGRKEKDWISSGQLTQKTGSSRRAISSATEVLVRKNLIEVSDEKGNVLSDSVKRKGKTRMYYRLSPTLFSPVEKLCKADGEEDITEVRNANFALYLRKKRQEFVQKMRITKETLQN